MDRNKLAVRQEGTASWTATIKAEKLTKHGVHVAVIEGRAKGQRFLSFEVPVVMVRPHIPGEVLDNDTVWRSKLGPGAIERHFFSVPPGAESLRLDLTPVDKRYSRSRLYLYDPEGREFASPHRSVNSESGATASFEITGERLSTGVWEAVIYATFRNTQPSEQKLTAQFLGLAVPHSADYWVPDGGGVKTSFEVVNRFDSPVRGPVSAQLTGTHRALTEGVEGPEFEHFFTVAPHGSGAKIALSMPAEDYHLFTDIAVNIVNSSGAVVAQSGFGSRFLDLNVQQGPGEYRLVVKGATANAAEPPMWTISIDETHTFKTAVPMTVSGPSSSPPTFYPGVVTPLDLETAKALPERPEDFGLLLELSVLDQLNRGTRTDFRVTLQR